MRFFLSTVLLLPALASAFAPVHLRMSPVTSLCAKPAKSYEQDLKLTREVISKFNDGDSSSAEDSSDETEDKEE